MTEYEFEVLKKYIDDDDELARIVAEDKEFEEQESKIGGAYQSRIG